MVFCYVILHYRTDKDTVECINSIFNTDDKSFVVVVDNASCNGSIENVENAFKDNERVHIIKNSENLGFAGGNNTGYQYARKVLHADYIALSNNDIIIVSKDFPDRVRELYDKTAFSVMGPDIVSLVDDGHQNPMEESYHSAREVKKEISRYKMLLAISKCGLYDLLKPNRKVRTGTTNKTVPDKITDNVTLHGSFMVFSPAFVEHEEIAFREGTFLYVEEAILSRYCRTKDYKMVFDPELCVHHKEDSSTNSLKLSNRQRREFVFRNMIQSLSVYLKYFDQPDNAGR